MKKCGSWVHKILIKVHFFVINYSPRNHRFDKIISKRLKITNLSSDIKFTYCKLYRLSVYHAIHNTYRQKKIRKDLLLKMHKAFCCQPSSLFTLKHIVLQGQGYNFSQIIHEQIQNVDFRSLPLFATQDPLDGFLSTIICSDSRLFYPLKVNGGHKVSLNVYLSQNAYNIQSFPQVMKNFDFDFLVQILLNIWHGWKIIDRQIGP